MSETEPLFVNQLKVLTPTTSEGSFLAVVGLTDPNVVVDQFGTYESVTGVGISKSRTEAIFSAVHDSGRNFSEKNAGDNAALISHTTLPRFDKAMVSDATVLVDGEERFARGVGPNHDVALATAFANVVFRSK